jgi:hypothetical protein
LRVRLDFECDAVPSPVTARAHAGLHLYEVAPNVDVVGIVEVDSNIERALDDVVLHDGARRVPDADSFAQQSWTVFLRIVTFVVQRDAGGRHDRHRTDARRPNYATWVASLTSAPFVDGVPFPKAHGSKRFSPPSKNANCRERPRARASHGARRSSRR